VHILPAGIVIGLLATWPRPIDLVIAAVVLGYAIGLMSLATAGPDALSHATLEGALPASRALRLVAGVMLLSAVVDLATIADFEWSHGAHAAVAIGIANLLTIPVIGIAATVAGRAQTPVDIRSGTWPPHDDQDVGVEHGDVVAKIETLMRTQELYRDGGLNLSRLARRAGLPTRSLSTAINRHRGQSVSHFVNGHRIAKACELLLDSDQPITQIMFDVGFQTKSNFNREFRRVAGMSPRAWREHARKQSGECVGARLPTTDRGYVSAAGHDAHEQPGKLSTDSEDGQS
jgi:AraC-like DNA-binding protein